MNLENKLTKEQFGALKNQLLFLLEEIGRLFDAEQFNARQIRSLRQHLADDRFQIIVVGEFSSGKSTFINSLLGADLLPSKVKPTTATLGIIRDGEPQATAFYKDGSEKPIPLEQLKTFATALDQAGAEEARKISHMLIRYPCPITKDGVEIIDTPGVNELNKQREEITYELIPKADAAILLMDARRPYKYSEKDFVEQKLVANQIGKIFFVLNFIDTVIEDEEDPQEIVGYTKHKLAESVPDAKSPRVYALSARRSLDAKLAGDGDDVYLHAFRAFEEDLESFLVNEKGALMIRNIAVKAMQELKGLYEILLSKHASLDLPLHELQAKEAEFAEQLRQFEAQRHQLEAEIKSGFYRLPELFQAEIAQAVRSAINEIGQIDVKNKTPEQFKQETEAVFNEAMHKSLERSVLPNLTRQIEQLMTQAQARADLLIEKLEQFHQAQLVIDPAEMSRLFDLSHIFRGSSVGGQQLLLGIGAWFGVPLIVSTFATGGLALIPWAIGMAASIFGIIVWGENREKKLIVKHLRQAEQDIAFKVRQAISEKVREVYEQFSEALDGRMADRIENMKAALREMIANKAGMADEIEAKKAVYEERMRQTERFSSQLRDILDVVRQQEVVTGHAFA